MDSKVNYIVVGLFVIVLAAALLAGVLWFSAGLHGTYRQYLMYTAESVSGLSVDAAVRYRGVKVGRVAEITLTPGDPSRVRLLLDIEEGTPVKTDTQATLEMQGLTGLMNVNLVGGTREAKLLAATMEGIPVIPSKPSLMGQLSDQADALVRNLSETSARLSRLLSDENQAALTQTLANLERVTGTLASEADTLADTLVELRQVAAQARRAGDELPAAIGQFRQSAVALERMANELASVGTAVRTEVGAGGTQIRRFMGEALPAAAGIVDELRETAANLRRLSESLERDPSVLVYGAGQPAPGPGE
jgi:phospholipid/cholesterol/gamma-HCH transport system substrate-binding protein